MQQRAENCGGYFPLRELVSFKRMRELFEMCQGGHARDDATQEAANVELLQAALLRYSEAVDLAARETCFNASPRLLIEIAERGTEFANPLWNLRMCRFVLFCFVLFVGLHHRSPALRSVTPHSSVHTGRMTALACARTL